MDSSASQSEKSKKTRSRTGCRTCRARKVKCDERPDGCANCERLNITCSQSEASSSRRSSPVSSAANHESLTEAGLRRHRTFRSCGPCRAAKARCSGEKPKCQRCQAREVECSYSDRAAPQWVTKAQQSLRAARLREEDGRESVAGGSSAASDATMHESIMTGDDSSASPEQRRDSLKDVGLNWLLAPSLPTSRQRLACLVDEYFANVHPLRCFGFVHKPSFVVSLEDQTATALNSNILLLVICALGAKFHATKSVDDEQSSDGFILHAGSQWARKAHHLLVTNMSDASVEMAMATVLLHEHELRVGNYASAFMMTGLTVRLAQGHELSIEYSNPNAPNEKSTHPPSILESRRRLMWSVYAMDAWVGSGVDELTLVNDKHIKLLLPCSETDFILEIPTTEQHLNATLGPCVKEVAYNLELSAQFVRLVSIRKKALRHVKHLEDAQDPWLPKSEFNQLQSEFDEWYKGLSQSLLFSRNAVQKRKVSGQHGALLFLHLTYYQSLCDLTRIGMPDLFKLGNCPIRFPVDQTSFARQVQDLCFDSCMAVSTVFQESLKHGPECLADTWLCVVAHDSTRVIIHYMANNLGTSQRRSDPNLHAMVIHALSSNVLALQKMIPLFSLAKSLHGAAVRMARDAGYDIAASDNDDIFMKDPLSPSSDSKEPALPHGSPETFLNPLAIYRMARKDIQSHEAQSLKLPLHTAAQRQISPSNVPHTLVPHSGYDSGASSNTLFLPSSDASIMQYMGLPQMVEGYTSGMPYDIPVSGPMLETTGQEFPFPPQPMMGPYGESNPNTFGFQDGDNW